MIRFTPSLDHGDAHSRLDTLIPPHLDPSPFQPALRRLRRMSAAFAAFCPPPWPSPGLDLTPEIHYQSELWLPLAELQPTFSHFRRAALGCAAPPGGAPFDDAASWAGVAATLPPPLASCTTPARLLHRLVTDREVRRLYLFRASMPKRFYGGTMDRYPRQTAFIRHWLEQRTTGDRPLCCLDAACGDGAATYGLARLLLDRGFAPRDFLVQGWTIDPLEVWAAAHCAFPHDPPRQETFRRWTLPIFAHNTERSLSFQQVNLLIAPPNRQCFHLILCNGLLGGPILNKREEMRQVVGNLATLLMPGGLVLAANSFHGGWKQKCPHHEVRALFASAGLTPLEAGEGISGLKGED